MKQYEYILFDLDGTLTESHEGIINSVRYALRKKGLREPEYEKLLTFVGPPLVDSFTKYYASTPQEAKELVEIYREYFTERGWKENRVYEGIPQMLQELCAAGKKLVVATSKPEVSSKKILSYFGLDSYFDRIVGSTLDGRINSKGQVIAEVLRQIGTAHGAEAVMVGDREHDVFGAAEHGIPCIGVLYGYGSRQELETAGAVALCPAVADLPGILLN